MDEDDVEDSHWELGELVQWSNSSGAEGQDDDEEPEPLPSELDTTRHSHFVEVSKNKLGAFYVGRGNHTHDVGSVRANHPCPCRRSLYYYEVEVVNAGLRGCITVGLADQEFLLNTLPGWEPGSYGYRCDDGALVCVCPTPRL